MKNKIMPLNLQFFADGDNGGGDGNGQGSQDQQGAQSAAGADNNQNGTGDDNNNGTGNNESNNKTEKTFTQHQVSAMMSKEKKQGRAAAYAELGINPEDTKMVSMLKNFINAQKTDEQKAAEELSASAAKVVEAEKRAMIAEAKVEALSAGVNPEYVDDCVTVAISKVNDTTDLATAFKELKEKYPVWFNASDNSGKGNVGQKGTGTSISNMGSTAGGNDGKGGLAAKLAAAKKGNSTSKSSFWS